MTATSTVATRAEVAYLAAEIADTAADLRVDLFSLGVTFANLVSGHTIVAYIGRSEDRVNLLADALGLPADDGTHHDRYVRTGDVRGVTVEVWTARTSPRCACGATCDHKAVTA